MNFKNWTENLLIILVSVSIGGAIGYFASLNANKQALRQLTPTIERAIDKETIKNEIKNEIDIDKVKKSDSLKIIFDPTSNQDPVNVISGGCPEGYVCIPIKDLTRKQRRNLD